MVTNGMCPRERTGPRVTRSLGQKSAVGSEPQRGSVAHRPALWAVSESSPRLCFVLEIKGMRFRFLVRQAHGSSVSPCVAGMWSGEAWQGSLAGKWLLSSQEFAGWGTTVGNAGICCRLIVSILQSAPDFQERRHPKVLQPQLEASCFKRSACFLCALWLAKGGKTQG